MIKLKDLIKEVIKGKFIITNKAKDSFMKSYRKGLLGSTWTNNKEEATVFATLGSAKTVIRMFPVHRQRNWRIMNLEESVNEDAIPYSVGFPIVRKFADRLSFGPKLERDGNTFFLQGHMKIDNAAIKKELQRHYEIRRIDRGSRGSNEYYVYDKDSGYVMLVQPSKKDNWIQMSPFTTIEDWQQYESVNESKSLFIKNNKEISKIIRSSKKGDIFTVWAKGPATFKDEVGVFQNVGMMTDFGSKRRLPAFQELGSAGKPKELYITGIRKITIKQFMPLKD